MKETASAVKQLALRHGIEVFQPLTLKSPEAQAKIAGVKADAMIVAMLPGWETSTGVKHEIHAFIEAGKPVFFLNPADLSLHRSAA